MSETLHALKIAEGRLEVFQDMAKHPEDGNGNIPYQDDVLATIRAAIAKVERGTV